jgi:hypothetical protein
MGSNGVARAACQHVTLDPLPNNTTVTRDEPSWSFCPNDRFAMGAAKPSPGLRGHGRDGAD